MSTLIFGCQNSGTARIQDSIKSKLSDDVYIGVYATFYIKNASYRVSRSYS